MRGRRALAAVVLVLALVAAGLMVWWRSPRPAGSSAYADARLVALNAQLAQVPGPYHLLVGDSQAERLYLPELCGTAVINAGLGGARAAVVRRMAEALALPRPPEATVVMVGTNDLQARRDPAAPTSREGFRAEVRALIAGLARRGATVYATPIPPLDPARAAGFAAGEAAAYSAIVREECARAGCRFAEVFPADAARSPDGVHLATADVIGPDGVAARLARAACPR